MADRYESQARAQTENLHDPKSVIIYYHLHATYTATSVVFAGIIIIIQIYYLFNYNYKLKESMKITILQLTSVNM